MMDLFGCFQRVVWILRVRSHFLRSRFLDELLLVNVNDFEGLGEIDRFVLSFVNEGFSLN